MSEPITRKEMLLNLIAEGTGTDLIPVTREEIYLNAIANGDDLPNDMTPITREEFFLQKILDNGGTSHEYVNGNEVSF